MRSVLQKRIHKKGKCPFCQIDCIFLYEIQRWDPPFRIYQCPSCKLQMQFVEDPYRFYHKDYYEGKGKFYYLDERKYEKFFRYVWQARLHTIQKYKPPPGNFLDIGCSFGGLVKMALHYGYFAEGIDISSYAVQEAQKDPLLKNRIHCSNILDYSPSHQYDIITLIEVIEHLPEPVQVFRKLTKLLKKGGLLVIQTANFDGWQAKLQKDQYHYYLPGHLFYYSKSNLISFLKQYGFKTFISFHGTDFGVLPKLKKMRGWFRTPMDYIKFFRVIGYHYISKIAFGNFALTSSMVLYAFKD